MRSYTIDSPNFHAKRCNRETLWRVCPRPSGPRGRSFHPRRGRDRPALRQDEGFADGVENDPGLLDSGPGPADAGRGDAAEGSPIPDSLNFPVPIHVEPIPQSERSHPRGGRLRLVDPRLRRGPRGPDRTPRPGLLLSDAGNDWGRLDAAARQVALTAILNPDSGPGKTADPNYVKATDNLRAAGGSVVAYVSTSYGERSLAAVKEDIARYTRFYKVDGFLSTR